MFRSEFQLYNAEGRAERVVTIDQLRALSRAEINDYLNNLLIVSTNLNSVIAKMEMDLMATYGYHSLEATRKGLRAYADGTLQRKADELNDLMDSIRASRISPEPMPARQEQTAQQKKLMAVAVQLAKNYVTMVESSEHLEKQAKILRTIASEKDVTAEATIKSGPK